MGKTIKCHEGSGEGRSISNTSVEGLVSVTATEASPGIMTDEELYNSAETLMSAAADAQLSENRVLLEILQGSK